MYCDKQICEWLAKFPQFITHEIIRLADFLNEKPADQTFDIMQVARVVVLPQDLGSFVDRASYYLSSDKNNWIQQCLEVLPI